jgi:hypothetical protein
VNVGSYPNALLSEPDERRVSPVGMSGHDLMAIAAAVPEALAPAGGTFGLIGATVNRAALMVEVVEMSETDSAFIVLQVPSEDVRAVHGPNGDQPTESEEGSKVAATSDARVSGLVLSTWSDAWTFCKATSKS